MKIKEQCRLLNKNMHFKWAYKSNYPHLYIFIPYKTGFCMIIHPTKHRNQWNLCLEMCRSTLIQHTYLATPPFHFGACKT